MDREQVKQLIIKVFEQRQINYSNFNMDDVVEQFLEKIQDYNEITNATVSEALDKVLIQMKTGEEGVPVSVEKGAEGQPVNAAENEPNPGSSLDTIIRESIKKNIKNRK